MVGHKSKHGDYSHIHKGQLTDTQVREYQDAFHIWDKGNKGYIDSKYLADIVRELGFNPTETDLCNIFWTVDENNNNRLEFEEFLKIIIMLGELVAKDGTEYRDAFNAYDRDNKGYIPSAVIRESIMDLMKRRSESETEDLLKTFRLDVDRKVYFEEFKGMIHTQLGADDE